jgi:CheY-like chemotaxis protein
MPVMDGLEATRQIRCLPNGSGLAILAATANWGPEQSQNCMNAGMTGFITKPFAGAVLLEAVVRWIDTPQKG